MVDIVQEAAIVTMAKTWRDVGYSPEYFIERYANNDDLSREYIKALLLELELIYTKYPENEWFRPDYDKEPFLFWQEY